MAILRGRPFAPAATEASSELAASATSSNRAALEADLDAREELRAFTEPRYLHQVVTRAGGRFPDLSQFLDAPSDGSTARVHFHVPVYEERMGRLATTQADLRAALAAAVDPSLPQRALPELEIETYTWGVMGATGDDLASRIARELAWTLARLAELGFEVERP